MLGEAGHDAVHVTDRGLAGSSDLDVMRLAAPERRVLISLDTDFGEILANSTDRGPSVVLFRRRSRKALDLADLLLANLEPISADLEGGALAVIEERRLRSGRCPFAERRIRVTSGWPKPWVPDREKKTFPAH